MAAMRSERAFSDANTGMKRWCPIEVRIGRHPGDAHVVEALRAGVVGIPVVEPHALKIDEWGHAIGRDEDLLAILFSRIIPNRQYALLPIHERRIGLDQAARRRIGTVLHRGAPFRTQRVRGTQRRALDAVTREVAAVVERRSGLR